MISINDEEENWKGAPPIRGCNKMWTWKSAHVQRKVPIKSGLYGPENIYVQVDEIIL